MILLFILISILETVGVGLVGPFISLATNFNSLEHDSWLYSISNWFNFASKIHLLIFLGCLVITIIYIKSFLSFFIQKYVFEFGYKQQGSLTARLMHAYMSAPYTYHLETNSAVLINNMINETSNFTNGFMMPLLTSVSNLVVIFALTLLLIKTNSIAMIIILGILIIGFFLFNRLKERMGRWGKESSDAINEMIRLINHSMGGLKETKVIGCETYFEEQMYNQIDKYAVSISSAIGFSNLPRYIIEAFLITFLVIFTFLFITINQNNTQNLSSVLGIFALASIRLLPATGNLLTSITGIKSKSYTVDKLYLDLRKLEKFNKSRITSESSFVAKSKTLKTLPFAQNITIEQIDFSYTNASRKSIDKISLTVEKGEAIGLIGKSGAGKTTLVDIILGLLTPQSGDIKVDDNSIYTNLRSWQKLVGYVPQSIYLIDDTLAHNIAFGVPDSLLDRGRLNKAIAAAQLTELVEQLPQGIETMVGERGVMLSGGQRQRVGIARALYHEREILVFDEATAALDNETEKLVTEAINSLSGTKTMIIIAHRLSTIEHCDRIYILENGRVIKSGSYQEIVLKK
ncbi:ABC transporter ATP-binding protein [Myxosarcina sp. GI1]|uniref:ABC transporter ATP-binding protein n=1 Tax=Myxosarcina sp. GI1 TaxID=1541065 RepID=UPI000A69E9D5